MVPSTTARAVLVLLAILAIGLLLVIALPFATPLFIAAVLAGALAPWLEWLAALLGGRRRLAGGLLTFGVLVAVVGPLSGLGASVVPQIVTGFQWIKGAMAGDALDRVVQRFPESLQPIAKNVHDAIPSTIDRLQELVTAEGGRAAAVLGNVLTATGSFVLRSVLMLIALYFMLVDGPSLVRWLNEAIPLKRGQVSEFLRDFRRVTVAVLVSTVASAAIQSVLALAGYLIAGVPSPLFFTLVTFVLGVIPLIGATVVVLAVSLVQIATGHVLGGTLLAIFAVGVIGMVDNVVKPLFIRGGVPIHGAVIFFALLGGIAAFGPVGFLAGPLAVSFLVTVIRMYRRDYAAGGALRHRRG